LYSDVEAPLEALLLIRMEEDRAHLLEVGGAPGSRDVLVETRRRVQVQEVVDAAMEDGVALRDGLRRPVSRVEEKVDRGLLRKEARSAQPRGHFTRSLSTRSIAE